MFPLTVACAVAVAISAVPSVWNEKSSWRAKWLIPSLRASLKIDTSATSLLAVAFFWSCVISKFIRVGKYEEMSLSPAIALPRPRAPPSGL